MRRDRLRPLVELLVDRRRSLERCALIGLGGGVAAGKSTLAADLADELLSVGMGTSVVSTDGFLLPNAELAERGLTERKGFPESYDVAAIEGFLEAMANGEAFEVPTYDHHIYDIVDTTITVIPGDIVIVEGVNALRFADRLDLTVYLHAEVADLRATFVQRALGLRDAARTEYSPFFDAWTDVPDDLFLAMADGVWAAVNLPNLTDHIAPARATADVIVHRGGDHSILSIDTKEP